MGRTIVTAAITYSAPGAVVRPSVRTYRTLDHARQFYPQTALSTAQREAERLGKVITVELWEHWGTLNARRVAYREV